MRGTRDDKALTTFSRPWRREAAADLIFDRKPVDVPKLGHSDAARLSGAESIVIPAAPPAATRRAGVPDQPDS
jgi:hypothetical protein